MAGPYCTPIQFAIERLLLRILVFFTRDSQSSLHGNRSIDGQNTSPLPMTAIILAFPILAAGMLVRRKENPSIMPGFPDSAHGMRNSMQLYIRRLARQG